MTTTTVTAWLADEAVRAGKEITRITLAFEAGRDGLWLARWLEACGAEAHVIHPFLGRRLCSYCYSLYLRLNTDQRTMQVRKQFLYCGFLNDGICAATELPLISIDKFAIAEFANAA